MTFLAYFHYNNKGIFPFSDECKDQELKNLAELDGPAMDFVRDTRKHAIAHSKFDAPLPPLSDCSRARRATQASRPQER